MRNAFALCFFVLLAGVTASAQQPAPDTRPFRTDIEAIEIDVRVLDERGAPVAGLTAGDFEVFEDGVRQEVRLFTPVRVPVVPRQSDGRVEPDTQSNRVPFNGRIYVFVLDDLHTHPLRSNRTKAVVRRFLDRHFAGNDRMAIVTTSGRTDAAQELTGSRAALLRALDAFQGRRMRSSTLEKADEYYRLRNAGELTEPRQKIKDPYEQERAHQASRAMSAVRDVAQWLDSVPARRKALIFVSEGIDYDITNLIDNRFASGVLADVQDAIARSQRSNTNIYAIDPRGLGGIDDETIEATALPDDTTEVGPSAFLAALRMAQDSLRVLAEETGGFALVNTNDVDGGFTRVVRDSSEYYVLGYQSTNPRRDGRFRKLDVRVTRPGLRAVARRGYYAAKAGDRAPASRATGPAAMRALIDSPLPVSGLPLDTAVTVFRGAKDKASVLVTAEIGPEFTLTEKNGVSAGRVEISTVAIDMHGKVAAADHRHVDLNLRPATREGVMRHGIRNTGRIELKPGRYQLRIAARDPNGTAAGSVHHDLFVPAFEKSPIAMSDLLLASQAAVRTATTNVDEGLKGSLTAPPTVAREFGRGDVLTVFAELYDHRTEDAVPAVPIAVTTTITDAAGRVVFRSEESVEAFAFEPTRHAYRHALAIPLRDIAAGDYVLRVAAVPRSRSDASAAREVAIAVREEQATAD